MSREFSKHVTLSGTNGSINSLAFSPDNKRLASGGDDERVRIWSLNTSSCEHELAATHRYAEEHYGWGQITSLLWVNPEAGVNPVLFVGTGRGTVILFEQTGNTISRMPKQVISVFKFNDSVECSACSQDRFAFASHSGHIKLFRLSNGQLESLWEINTALPTLLTGLTFYGRSKLFAAWLDTGRLCSLRDTDGAEEWSKHLNGAIGHASFTRNRKKIAAYNVNTGHFDVYSLPDASFVSELRVSHLTTLVKESVFVDLEGRQIACGGDDGHVYIFDTDNGDLVQKLVHQPASAVQAIAASGGGNPMIASADDTSGIIVVWSSKPVAKPLQKPSENPEDTWRSSKYPTVLELILFMLMCIQATLIFYLFEERLMNVAGTMRHSLSSAFANVTRR
ncbi:hypothetical protein VNI00_002502 [Paramarasmius palmivorus]|uniref:WD40 repeat-like protein n=1 Tax=Paramarasmius palmivorus TaxID=297713 RepID=A0AAW0DXM8_9AGAR